MREHSSLAKLQDVMTEYFKVLVEKEKNAERLAPSRRWEAAPPAPVTPPSYRDEDDDLPF